MRSKIILDLCGGTGAWSKPYLDAGYDVRNITLPDYDVRKTGFGIDNILFFKDPEGNRNPSDWIKAYDVYGILAAPPCEQFSFAKTTGKTRDLKKGMEIVIACLKIIWACQYKVETPYAKKTTLKFWALENPNGLLKRFLGKPVFEFNPYDFGDEYQKQTYLWGFFNDPKKNPIKLSTELKRLSRTHSQPPAKYMKFDMLKTKDIAPKYYEMFDRATRRAITPPGFAKAFFESNQ